MTDVHYHDYLQLDKILAAQLPESDKHNASAHDEMLFIIIHQAYELWFKQLHYEVDSLHGIMRKPTLNDNSPELQTVVHRLNRMGVILRVLVHQIDILETMTPMDFLDFRDRLRPASGFQSWQFKLLEAKLGLKFEYRHGKEYYTSQLRQEHVEMIKNAESEQSFLQLVNDWLERMPLAPPSPRGGVAEAQSPLEHDTDALAEEEAEYRTADPMNYGLLKQFVKEHRSKPTQAEDALWQQLQEKQLANYKFRRQHIIGNYIADFVCLPEKLVVEVDGLIHQLPANKESDEARTQWLQSKGYRVVRFTNEEITHRLDKVLNKILQALKNNSRQSKTSISEAGAYATPPSGGWGAFDFWTAYKEAYENSLAEAEKNNLEAFDEVFFQQRESHYTFSAKANRAALFIMLYRGYPLLQLPFQLLNNLLDIDEQLSTWRHRHMNMVHRMIGTRIGTGGSSGKDYLKAAADKHYIFKEIAQLTSFLIERRKLPQLPKAVERKLGFAVED
ncbi:MAG TPA: tryptophan 2,3-dioxygenase family protein [Flavisolibacter sp.]|nr:tryptophan 2,3-dioxygenase family protein [Flavisolibacter sp.]